MYIVNFVCIMGTNKSECCKSTLLGSLFVNTTELNRTRKLQTPTSSYLTMRRKDSARGTVYQLAHACGELARQLG